MTRGGPGASSTSGPAEAAGASTAVASDGVLPADALAAKDALRAALVTRSPLEVSAAARACHPWKGRDRELDLLLADALANVIMNPDPALALLERWRDPKDPEWRRVAKNAAMRRADEATLTALWREEGLQPVVWTSDVVGVTISRARQDPGLDADTFHRVVVACTWLQGRDLRAHQEVDLPVPGHLLDTARRLGATQVVVARPTTPGDGDPYRKDAPWICGKEALVDLQELPERLGKRGLLIGLGGGGGADLWLDLSDAPGVPTVIGASDVGRATRLLLVADDVAQSKEPLDDAAFAAVVERRHGRVFSP